MEEMRQAKVGMMWAEMDHGTMRQATNGVLQAVHTKIGGDLKETTTVCSKCSQMSCCLFSCKHSEFSCVVAFFVLLGLLHFIDPYGPL